MRILQFEEQAQHSSETCHPEASPRFQAARS
jgi:hypothetical protein